MLLLDVIVDAVHDDLRRLGDVALTSEWSRTLSLALARTVPLTFWWPLTLSFRWPPAKV